MRWTWGFFAMECSFLFVPFPSLCGAENLVSNPGFEEPVLVASHPTGYAYWSGDVTESVWAENDISPADGDRMLHFVYTRASGPSLDTETAESWQLLEVTQFAAVIASGKGLAVASARFNRVPGDANTDTEFVLSLGAYAGDPNTFPSQWGVGELAQEDVRLISDADRLTWELADLQMGLPTNTSFVAVRVGARENVLNDGTGPELDGHYADSVTVWIIPEPTTLSLLALGGVTLVRRKRL